MWRVFFLLQDISGVAYDTSWANISAIEENDNGCDSTPT